MNVLVLGNWHLALVTSASLLKLGHNISLLTNENTFLNYKKQLLPVDEKGIKEILFQKPLSKSFDVFSDLSENNREIDICWICEDIDLDSSINERYRKIIELFKKLDSYLLENIEIVISSQIPLGTSKKIIEACRKKIIKKRKFFIVPENLQLGEGTDSFLNQRRFIIGSEKEIYAKKSKIFLILSKITEEIHIMSYASAELSKHALNTFLALNISFGNEIGRIARLYGASSLDIIKSLKSDPRVSDKAYIIPGSAFHGGTLKRDLKTLEWITEHNNLKIPLINSIIESNNYHSYEILRIIKLNKHISKLLIIGLSYKLNSNTLRDSFFIRDLESLSRKNYSLKCYDPDVRADDPNLDFLRFDNVEFLSSIENIIIKDLDCLVINKIHQKDILNLKEKLKKISKSVNKFIVIDLNGYFKRYSSKLENIKFEFL